ncbi:MAG: hypothetical protein OXI55_04400 [Gammaproteobacteria bacterium]|nr:hypothetical protein [Gammaproteobacteria bacterium]
MANPATPQDSPTPAAEPDQRRARPGGMRSFGHYAAELLVVFLGVYLGFLVTDYQEELREREVRGKYYDSLILEFKTLVAHLDAERAKLDRHLAVVAEIDEGGQPDLPYIDLDQSAYGERASVLTAAFAGRNFEALDFGMLRNIITGLPALDMLRARVARLGELSVAILEPLRSDQTRGFYDAEGRLRGELAWYPRLIREIDQINAQLRHVVAELAIPDIEQDRAALDV